MPPRSAVKDTETIYSQNSRGLRTDKLEEVMATLMKLGLLAWCLQETWRLKLEQLDHHDTGCLSINHGLEEKVCRRGSLGVMIVLSPRAKAAYERGGCKKKTYGIRILSVLLVMEDEHEKMVKIRLVSAYAPTSNHPEDEHELYRGHLQQAVTEAKQNNEILIVGTDMNASCGRHDATMDDDTVQSPVGKHGNSWVNKAGEQMLSFCGLNDLCLPKSFFQKNFATRGTWTHPRSGKSYEIDQWMMRREDLKRVVDCGTAQRHSAYSDHTAVFLKIRIAKGLRAHTKPKKSRFSRDRLKDEDTANAFAQAAEEFVLNAAAAVTEPNKQFPQGESKVEMENLIESKEPECGEDGVYNGGGQQVLQEAFHFAEEKLGSKTKANNPSWYRMRQASLQKMVDKRNSMNAAVKMVRRKIETLGRKRKLTEFEKKVRRKTVAKQKEILEGLKGKLRANQSKLKKMVKSAKLAWMSSRIEYLNNPNSGNSHFIGKCWEAAKQIAGGPDAKNPVVEQIFGEPESGFKEEAKDAERSGVILEEHLEKLLNAVPAVQDAKIASVRQRAIREEKNAPPTSDEIQAALRRQNSGKASGDSDIPAEYFKLCTSNPLCEGNPGLTLQNLFETMMRNIWMDEEPVPKEWKAGRIKMLSKSGNLLDPGRWRSITLLDAAGKVMSTILTNRLNKILADEGLEEQNGFTPGRGTVDGSFCVRTMLAKRKEHNVETWAYFLDLVKAFDTVPRVALLKVLAKFGVPDRMLSMIRRMLEDNVVMLQVKKKSAQSDDIMEDVDVEIKSTAGVPQGNSMSPVLFIVYIQAVLETLDQAFVDAGKERHKPVFRTKIDHVIHGRKWNDASEGMTEFELAEAMYADDACLVWDTRNDMGEGAVVVDRHFTAFGLQVHKGRPGKKSKTECMYFPPAKGKTYEEADTTNLLVDDGFYTFCKRFKYLGSIITYDLRADDDVKTRIRCAAYSFKLMRNVLTSKWVKFSVKAQIYKVIVCTVLLYGSECWAMRRDLLDKLEKFHNQCVRTMSGVTLFKQWRGHIRNRELRKRFMNLFRRKGGTKETPIFKPLGTIEDMLTERNLCWAGHVARMPPTRLPRMLISAHVHHKRPKQRPFQTFGHACGRSMKVRIAQIHQFLGPDDELEGDDGRSWNAFVVANCLRWRGDLGKPVYVDCKVHRGPLGTDSLGVWIDGGLRVVGCTHERARNAGFFLYDRLVQVNKVSVSSLLEVQNALNSTDKVEIVCRVERRHTPGDPTWIDIANDRTLWTSLVYELFHDAKDY